MRGAAIRHQAIFTSALIHAGTGGRTQSDVRSRNNQSISMSGSAVPSSVVAFCLFSEAGNRLSSVGGGRRGVARRKEGIGIICGRQPWTPCSCGRSRGCFLLSLDLI